MLHLNLFNRVKSSLRYFRSTLVRLSYVWAYIPFVGDLFVKKVLLGPPVLVLSFPRSGSSWLGAKLALSANSAYLREPINSEFLSLGGRNTLKSIIPSRPDILFQTCSIKAFLNAPRYDTNVVAYPKQWLPWNIIGRTLLIKEVNPLALEYWIEQFSPLIVFIVRHPAAIAASYVELGWLENDDVRDTPCTSGLSSFQVFGRRVGEVFNYSLSILENYPKHLVVRYEDLVDNESFELSRISSFAGLSFSQLDCLNCFDSNVNVNDLPTSRHHPFSLNRRANDQTSKWRRALPPEQVAEIKKGYLYYTTPYYQSSLDW